MHHLALQCWMRSRHKPKIITRPTSQRRKHRHDKGEQALVKKRQKAGILPPLRYGHQFPVCERDYHVGHQEEHELPVDEFVDGSLPLKEEPCEAAGSRAGHVALVRDGHLVLVKSCFPEVSLHLGKTIVQLRSDRNPVLSY